MELGYFGEVFGRPAHVDLPWLGEDAELNADVGDGRRKSRPDRRAVRTSGARRRHDWLA
jgi:hypothetical protein